MSLLVHRSEPCVCTHGQARAVSPKAAGAADSGDCQGFSAGAEVFVHGQDRGIG